MKEFKWTDELAKEFCEYVGLRVGEITGAGIKQHIALLAEDFKSSHSTEIEKKEFEIVKYGVNQYSNHDPEPDCEELGCTIYSIKRLSDGQIFSIGDKVTHRLAPHKTLEIVRFSIFEKTLLRVHHDYNGVDYSSINNLTKLPQRVSLFTTEDGFDIYEGDTSYIVETDLWCIVEDKGSKISSTTFWNCRKAFMSKSSAEEYLLMNKPCLSVKEVFELQLPQSYNSSFGGFFSLSETKLKELAKSKL